MSSTSGAIRFNPVSNDNNMNDTDILESLPREITFNGDSLVSVIAYVVVFVIAATGNLTVFITLYRSRKRKSRVNLFIMHLAVADLIVTFVMIPLEIGWHLTVAWRAGDVGCRILMFFRTFGFYLSSFILVAISFDRYFAITKPLRLRDAGARGKTMLFLCWVLSLVASIPQSVIFHQESHPVYPWFAQCVTFNFFPTELHEMAYNIFNMCAMYLMPLIVITVCYSLIVVEISRTAKQKTDKTSTHKSKSRSMGAPLRCSSVKNIRRARMNTLKMTVVIVCVFIVCWTPYFVMLAWWWLDESTAALINTKIQRGLFIFAVSNSCMNPIVYGMFSKVFRRQIYLTCCRRSILRQKFQEKNISKMKRNRKNRPCPDVFKAAGVAKVLITVRPHPPRDPCTLPHVLRSVVVENKEKHGKSVP